MKFEPVAENPDLWINPDPVGVWSRVAVCSRWADARKVAKRWGHKPAVVGPFRTEAGLDLVVRNLLANPQIRVVFLDGPDLLPTNGAMDAAQRFFEKEDVAGLRDDLREFALLLLAEEQAQAQAQAQGSTPPPTAHRPPPVQWTGIGAPADEVTGMIDQAESSARLAKQRPHLLSYFVDLADDRPGGKVVLLPPAPEATERAPHGDPGDRVAADTLSEVYVRLLHQVMVAGRVVPTQYGLTRELLDVVSVIRDPLASLVELWPEKSPPEKHPVLGLSRADLEAYYRESWVGDHVPEGASYGYGARMHGSPPPALIERILPASKPVVDAMEQIWGSNGRQIDQFESIRKLLVEKPDTRAAFLTPWRPDEDGGKESGRPCLVGAWFRTTPEGTRPGDWHVTHDEDLVDPPDGWNVWVLRDRERVGLSWGREHRAERSEDAVSWAKANLSGVERTEREPARLHLTVVFRSHDLFAAYPQNLGACCRWLADEVDAVGVKIGTVTCLSMSGHVYERDWARSDALWESYRRKGLRWDGRSMFRVEKVVDTSKEPPAVQIGDEARRDLGTGDGSVVFRVVRVHVLAGGVEMVDAQAVCWLDADGGTWHRENEARWAEVPSFARRFEVNVLPVAEWHELRGWRQPTVVRAVAMTPDGRRVVAVFEAPTGAALRVQLEDSGLVQEPGAWLWLGSEIERVERGT